MGLQLCDEHSHDRQVAEDHRKIVLSTSLVKNQARFFEPFNPFVR